MNFGDDLGYLLSVHNLSDLLPDNSGDSSLVRSGLSNGPGLLGSSSLCDSGVAEDHTSIDIVTSLLQV